MAGERREAIIADAAVQLQESNYSQHQKEKAQILMSYISTMETPCGTIKRKSMKELHEDISQDPSLLRRRTNLQVYRQAYGGWRHKTTVILLLYSCHGHRRRGSLGRPTLMTIFCICKL